MKLEIQAVGNPKFPRYIIANDQGEVFDGTTWTKDRDRALKYVHSQELALQFNALEERMYQSFPLREFAVPLHIRVRSEKHFTQKQLEEYLEQATAILLDHSKGIGPVEDSMVQLAVTWANMEEKAATARREKK